MGKGNSNPKADHHGKEKEGEANGDEMHIHTDKAESLQIPDLRMDD